MNNNHHKNKSPLHDSKLNKTIGIPEHEVAKLISKMQACLGPLAKPPRLKVAKPPGQKANAINAPTSGDQINNLTSILINEYQGLKNKYLSTLANYENYRKQVHNEHKEQQQYANADLATALLPIIDSFGRALQFKTVNQDLKNFLVGFKMIYKNLQSALTAIGVELITAKPGDIFNHNLHHAIANEATTLYPAGHIMKIVNDGYRLHDRILRHTEVIVAKTPVQPESKKELSTKDRNSSQQPPGTNKH